MYQYKLNNLIGHHPDIFILSLRLEASVTIAELKFLFNHTIDNATIGYLRSSTDYLRTLQEKATTKILETLGLVYTERH